MAYEPAFRGFCNWKITLLGDICHYVKIYANCSTLVKGTPSPNTHTHTVAYQMISFMQWGFKWRTHTPTTEIAELCLIQHASFWPFKINGRTCCGSLCFSVQKQILNRKICQYLIYIYMLWWSRPPQHGDGKFVGIIYFCPGPFCKLDLDLNGF